MKRIKYPEKEEIIVETPSNSSEINESNDEKKKDNTIRKIIKYVYKS